MITIGEQNETPVLNYAPSQTFRDKLSLIDSGDSAQLIFPAVPKWISIFNIIGTGVYGVGHFLVLGYSARMYQQMNPTSRLILFGMPRDLILLAILFLNAGGFWLLSSAHEFWRYKRWSRVSRVLSVDKAGVTKSWLGLFRMRERHWRAADITNVTLRPTRAAISRGRPR